MDTVSLTTVTNCPSRLSEEAVASFSGVDRGCKTDALGTILFRLRLKLDMRGGPNHPVEL